MLTASSPPTGSGAGLAHPLRQPWRRGPLGQCRPRPWPSPPGANEAPIHRPPLHQACGLGGRMGLLPRPRAALSSLWVTAVPVVVTESDPFTASCRPPFPTPHRHARLPGCSCPWLLTAPAGSQPGRALCHSAGLQGQKSPARAAQAAQATPHHPASSLQRPGQSLEGTCWLETLLARGASDPRI